MGRRRIYRVTTTRYVVGLACTVLGCGGSAIGATSKRCLGGRERN